MSRPSLPKTLTKTQHINYINKVICCNYNLLNTAIIIHHSVAGDVILYCVFPNFALISSLPPGEFNVIAQNICIYPVLVLNVNSAVFSHVYGNVYL